MRVAQYQDEFIVVPGCFGELPNWWRNFRKESRVDMFYKGKSMECVARTIEHDETDAVPRLAAYVRISHAAEIGITAETTEEMFNKLVTAAAKTYLIVTIRPRSTSAAPNAIVVNNLVNDPFSRQEKNMQKSKEPFLKI